MTARNARRAAKRAAPAKAKAPAMPTMTVSDLCQRARVLAKAGVEAENGLRDLLKDTFRLYGEKGIETVRQSYMVERIATGLQVDTIRAREIFNMANVKAKTEKKEKRDATQEAAYNAGKTAWHAARGKAGLPALRSGTKKKGEVKRDGTAQDGAAGTPPTPPTPPTSATPRFDRMAAYMAYMTAEVNRLKVVLEQAKCVNAANRRAIKAAFSTILALPHGG